MQLLVIDSAVSKNVQLNSSDLVFPALIVDVRDNTIKIANEEGKVFNVAVGNTNLNLVEYAHRKRFGIVENDVVDNSVLSVDSILTADEIKEHSINTNIIK